MFQPAELSCQKRKQVLVCLALSFFTSALMAFSCKANDVLLEEDVIRRALAQSPLGSPKPDPTNKYASNSLARKLGGDLFFEPRLSRNRKISCASCHDPLADWIDKKDISAGLVPGQRNTPSLWNVVFNRWFFWDGREVTLWAQALRPLESPVEMGSSRVHVAKLVVSIPEIRRQYEAVYGPIPKLNIDRFREDARPDLENPKSEHSIAWFSIKSKDREIITQIFVNVCKAIAAFETTIITPKSKFDRFVDRLRNESVQSEPIFNRSELRGLKLFFGKANCWLCHHGPNFTDGEFHNLMLPGRDGLFPLDPGRIQGVQRLKRSSFSPARRFSDERSGEKAALVRQTAVTPHQWGQFKTPSLRNVARTSPYMHDGQFSSLREVVEYYSTLSRAIRANHHAEATLRPLNLTENEIVSLIDFLKTLTSDEK